MLRPGSVDNSFKNRLGIEYQIDQISLQKPSKIVSVLLSLRSVAIFKAAEGLMSSGEKENLRKKESEI